MQQEPNPATENGIAVENACGATPAHPNSIAAREWDDAACDCDRHGGFAEYRESRQQGLLLGQRHVLAKPIGGRMPENMTLAEEKALLARFAKAAGAGELLKIHDLKAAYEQAIGHETSNSTVYNLLARHGWRKLMPRPFHPKRDLAAQHD